MSQGHINEPMRTLIIEIETGLFEINKNKQLRQNTKIHNFSKI